MQNHGVSSWQLMVLSSMIFLFTPSFFVGNTNAYIKYVCIQFSQSLKIIQTFQTAQMDLGVEESYGTHSRGPQTVVLSLPNVS